MQYLFTKLEPPHFLQASHVKTLFLLIELFGTEVQEKDENGQSVVPLISWFNTDIW